MIVRKWDWFSPISPPVKAFKLARIAINENDVFIIINDIIDNGASFCHVDKTKAGIHSIDVITDGYHRWHGAMPILIISENINTIFILYIIWLDSHSDILLIIKSLDPRAWTRRYFTEASVSWDVEDILIIGINEIKLSSIASQIINQFVLDRAIKVLIIMVRVVIIKNGALNSIKMRLELNHQIWVRSSYFALHTS